MIMNQLNLNISIGRQKKEHNLPPHLGSIGTRVALRGGALVAGDGEAGGQQRRGQAQAQQRGHHGSLCSLCIPAVSLLYPCCIPAVRGCLVLAKVVAYGWFPSHWPRRPAARVSIVQVRVAAVRTGI